MFNFSKITRAFNSITSFVLKNPDARNTINYFSGNEGPKSETIKNIELGLKASQEVVLKNVSKVSNEYKYNSLMTKNSLVNFTFGIYDSMNEFFNHTNHIVSRFVLEKATNIKAIEGTFDIAKDTFIGPEAFDIISAEEINNSKKEILKKEKDCETFDMLSDFNLSEMKKMSFVGEKSIA